MEELNEIHRQYLKSFNLIKPILADMKAHWKDLYPEYMGWMDLGSPIFDHPDILFVGINPGPGRFDLWNYGKPKDLYVIPKDYPTPWRSELHWTKDGVAREGKWFDKSSTQKNLFPKTMCELLVRIYRPDYPDLSREDMTTVFNQRVMTTNLYPMVTKDQAKLDKLIRRYCEKTDAMLTMVCRKHLFDLIKLVSPKVVVLLGKRIGDYLKPYLLKNEVCFYCIDRTRGWHGKKNIALRAEEIRKLLK